MLKSMDYKRKEKIENGSTRYVPRQKHTTTSSPPCLILGGLSPNGLDGPQALKLRQELRTQEATINP